MATRPAESTGATATLSASARPVRVAVVGCGYWGPNIIRNFSSIADCELRAICDSDPQRLESIRRRFPSAAGRTDFVDVLNDPKIDAVAICTPVGTHFPLVKAALEAGKHVLAEKPLTNTATRRGLAQSGRRRQCQTPDDSGSLAK